MCVTVETNNLLILFLILLFCQQEAFSYEANRSIGFFFLHGVERVAYSIFALSFCSPFSVFFPYQLGWWHNDLMPHSSGHGNRWSAGVDGGLLLRRQCTPYFLFNSTEHSWFSFSLRNSPFAPAPSCPVCDSICPNPCFTTPLLCRLAEVHTYWFPMAFPAFIAKWLLLPCILTWQLMHIEVALGKVFHPGYQMDATYLYPSRAVFSHVFASVVTLSANWRSLIELLGKFLFCISLRFCSCLYHCCDTENTFLYGLIQLFAYLPFQRHPWALVVAHWKQNTPWQCIVCLEQLAGSDSSSFHSDFSTKSTTTPKLSNPSSMALQLFYYRKSF